MEKYIKLKDFDKEEFVKVEIEADAPAQKNLITAVRLGDLTINGNYIYLSKQAAIDEDSTQRVGNDFVEINIDKSLREIFDAAETENDTCLVTFLASSVDPEAESDLIFSNMVAISVEDGELSIGGDTFLHSINQVISAELSFQSISEDSNKIEVKVVGK